MAVGSHLAGGRLEIWVSDTGSGIPAGAQAKIFESLFSTKNFGVGLEWRLSKTLWSSTAAGSRFRARQTEA